MFFSWTRSCSWLLWVYAIMFMFWPSQLTHEIVSWFGVDIRPPAEKQSILVNTKVAQEEDSDDSDEANWMFNSKNDGKATAMKVKSPKGLKDLPLLTEDSDNLETPELKNFRSKSVLKEGEHESTLYAPSNSNMVRLMSMRGRPVELEVKEEEEEERVQYGINGSFVNGSFVSHGERRMSQVERIKALKMEN